MEVWEKINFILKEKNISKKDFVDTLLSLEPRLKKSGEIPSVQTIYRYLNNQREIKIELIPYIAETLNITEQELFTNDIEYANDYNYKHSREAREILDLLKFAPRSAIEKIKNYLIKIKGACESSIEWDWVRFYFVFFTIFDIIRVINII